MQYFIFCALFPYNIAEYKLIYIQRTLILSELVIQMVIKESLSNNDQEKYLSIGQNTFISVMPHQWWLFS